MQDRIFLEALRISGSHGVNERERAEPQEFLLDLSISFDTSVAHASDALGDTYDYGRLRSIAQEVFAGAPSYLLERLAGQIAEKVLEDRRIGEVTVTIRKPHIYSDCVPGVSINRTRASL